MTPKAYVVLALGLSLVVAHLLAGTQDTLAALKSAVGVTPAPKG